MEKLKALIAVILFVAALLFAVNTNSTEKENTQPKAKQTIIINKQ